MSFPFPLKHPRARPALMARPSKGSIPSSPRELWVSYALAGCAMIVAMPRDGATIFGDLIGKLDMLMGTFTRRGAAAVAQKKTSSTELFRNVPANIHELRLALAGLPQDMKVLAEPETGVSEKTVEELCARTTWRPDLAVTTPCRLQPKSVVKISKAT